MWKAINFIQGLIIFVWTAICALVGMILLIITFNPRLAHHISGHYLWSPLILFVSGVRVKVKGSENIPANQPCVFVANHESLFDIVAIAKAINRPLFFVAKKELKKVPFMGWYMSAIGMIFVDRGDKSRAMESMKSAAIKIKKGKSIISFPEGTRSKTGELLMFKRGTFILLEEAGVPLVPIGISGARKVIPSGSFRLRPGIISVNIGKPWFRDQYSNLEIDSLASEMRNKVAGLRLDFV